MTPLTALLKIDLPIVQAPMAGVQGSALAIAVSNAGALGSLPCAMLDLDGIRRELTAIRAQTQRPFNVNFFCHAAPTIDEARETAWRRALAPYFEEFGVDPATIVPATRLPFDGAAADILAEFRPPVVSFHFGLPSPDLVARVRAWGARIFSSATTVEEARWLEARGVDAVIAQGVEAGGHRGMFLTDDISTQMGTMALVPQVVKAVAGSGDCGGRHCRRIRRARRDKPRRVWRAGRHQLSAVSRSDHKSAAPRRARKRCKPAHRSHQPVHGPACPRHRQSPDARDRANERPGAGVSVGGVSHRAAQSKGREPWHHRLFVDVGGPEHERMPRDSRGRRDSRACRWCCVSG